MPNTKPSPKDTTHRPIAVKKATPVHAKVVYSDRPRILKRTVDLESARTAKKFVMENPTRHRGPGYLQNKTPRRFEDLVRELPPRAIHTDAECDRFIATIDRLMALGRLSPGQEAYMNTLTQLVQVYEAERHAISTLRGLPALRNLLDENAMSGTDLARLLDVHVSMGSKILAGERSLTTAHIKKLAARFKVSPEVFLD